MKENRNVMNSLLACGVGLAMISSLAAQTPTDVGATVIFIKGPARFSLGNNNWQPLRVGDVLKAGAVIQTGKEDSYVDLALGDSGFIARPVSYKPTIPSSTSAYLPPVGSSQNLIRIWENSAMAIDKLTSMQTGADTVSDTELDLKAGHMSGIVKKMSAASRYEIKIPSGVAGIRGTSYNLWATGLFQIGDGSGALAYTDSQGAVQTKNLGPGQQCSSTGSDQGVLGPVPPGDMQRLRDTTRDLGTHTPGGHGGENGPGQLQAGDTSHPGVYDGTPGHE